MILFPLCKINIGLYILNKRDDGYHNISTIFYPIDNMKDRLEITRIDSGVRLQVEPCDFLCSDEDNLCIKAFRLLQQDFNIDGISIHLTKHIPTGAGLGGGSSDGATALIMYNELFNLHLSPQQLHYYASKLGSDVPFFLYNKPLIATGRGEILNPIDVDLSNYQIRIVKPDFSISTAEAYANITPHIPEIPLDSLIHLPINRWKDSIFNDFEKSLAKKYPIIEEIKEQLYREGAIYVSLSGSGSAIYAIF